MSLVVHKLVLSPGGATATTAQPTTAHHVTLSAYTHARSNATDSMGRVLDGPPSGSMSTPPASSSPYSSSSSNSSSSSKHSSTYNLPFVLQDHNYGAPPPPTPPHSPPPLPSTSTTTSSTSSHASSNTSSSSGSTYQHHQHHFQQQHHHQPQQQHQYHHHPHHHHHQTYQSASLAPSASASPSPAPSASSFTSHHHTSSSPATTPHHHQHHVHHHPATTSTTTITTPHHHHHLHHHHPTTTANQPHHHHPHHHQQQQQQQHHHQQHQQHHHSSNTTTTTTTPHLQQKHHNFIQHPGPSPRLGSSSSASAATPSSTTSSSSTSNTSSSSATSFSSPSLSVGGVMAHHPLTNMPPHRQQFMPHPKSSIVFPSPHIPPPPVELSQHHPHHHQSSPSSTTVPPQPVLPSTETDDDSRLSDRSSSVGPSGEETETAPEGEGDDLPADDSITRCVCDFSHDDGYMIQCDRCFVWQHVDCMEIDRDNIPDEYLCEACDPRPIDRFKARALQIRRRQEIKAHLARLSSSDSEDNIPMSTKSRGSLNKVQERKVVKKKKVKQIKDMKNGRKGGGGGGGSGQLSLLKKSGGGGNTTVTSCNNSLLPGQEDKDRRMLVKRRRKSNSLSGGEGVSDDSSGGPVERLRAWVEGYEAAVTNHYSPELRARVHAARINGVSPDLRASTQGAVLGHRCRVANNPRPLFDVFDSKILVAATRLSPNTAITEFQGKYLLASQWNAQQPVSSQPYMPYVLQYHMPKEGLTVCVDARTYGNDARFTRHSCTPNAEVRHVVERGSLHLYIVATREIEEGEEVTLALETANSTFELVCCLAEEHDCQAPPGPRPEQTTPAPALTHKKNGLIVGNKKTIKKQQLQLQLRTSKRTASSDTRLIEPAATTPVTPSTPVTTVKQRRASGCGKSPVKSPSTASLSSSPEEVSKDIPSNTPSSSTLSTATGTVPSAPDTPRTALDKQQQQKMTREERKIAAYMKAFERMEKAAQRRQEMEKKKEEDKGKEVRDPKEKDKKRCDGDEEDWEKTSSADECVRSMVGSDRCRRKGKKGRGKGSPQKRSNHRADSAASDLTGDESSCASVGLMSPSGGAIIESIALNFNSPPQGNPNAMGFRFPKTKKALMNEWLNENVDPVVPVGSVVGTDLPSGVPPCYMRSPAMPLRRSSLNQTTGTGVMPVQDMPGGSAKKRWLRQAISEETETPQFNGLCPSPNSRPDSPTGGGDYITPLKKRRLARESMSSELSSTPPSTPVHSTSLEEDKMVEEMEAELAEEDSHKTKSNCRYREDHQPSSPSAQDDTTCMGFLRSSADNNSNNGRMKRIMAQEDEEEEEEDEEDLVIDEGGSFFDQGSGAVNFGKVAACGRLSQGQAEEQQKEDKGRAVTRQNRRGKKVCYKPQEDEEEGNEEEEVEEDEEEEEEEEEDEDEEKEGSESEEMEDHEEKEKQNKVDNNRREPVKTTRRQTAVKKCIRFQQQTAKKGKKQQGVTAKKGKQETKAKPDTKRRKPVKRGKEEVLSVKEEEEEEEEAPAEAVEEQEEKETEEKEEKPTVKEEEEKPEVAEDALQRVKEESGQPEIKTEVTEPTTETDGKVEPESERQEQEVVKVETTIKKEKQEVEEEVVVAEKKVLDIKTEPDATTVCERIDDTKPHQDTAETFTTESKIEPSDNLKETERPDSEDSKPVDKLASGNQDKPEKVEVKEEVKEEEEEEEEDIERPSTDKEEVTEAKKTSEDNQESLPSATATPEASPVEAKEPVSRKAKEVEEIETSIDEEEPKKTVKKKVPVKGNRKVKKQWRQVKKAKQTKQKRKGVKESAEISHDEEEAVNERESSVEKAETEMEEETDGKQSDPASERRDLGEQSISKECPKSLPANKKRIEEGNTTQEPGLVKAAQCDARERSQTPTNEDVDKRTLHAKSDGNPVITLEAKWKLDTPQKTDEQTMEVSRKPPTPPTLFPPLPWQTNPESFSASDPLRPKSPENSGYLGMRGPRTPEGPAPTSPSDPTMSPPCCSPRSPHTSIGDSEVKGEDRRARESSTEASWRHRARGPCTPPTPPPQEPSQEEELQQHQEGGEESSSSPSQQHPPSNPESTQTRPAPVKKKLSILEYRKRKSVGGEAGPLDSSPPPCQPASRTSSGDSSWSTHEFSVRGGPHSPSQSSPPGLTGCSGEDGDSSPDLPLSPMGPILLPPSPISFDTRSAVEDTKRDGENYRSSLTGTGGSSDLNRHSIVNKIMSNSNSNSNNSSNTTSGSSSNISSSCTVTESSTAITATTTSTSTTAGHALHPISGGNSQDVRWNAAPTLLERQRENLTARLRREFGLCVADDDDEKSSVRLGCSGVLSRPSPPLLPPTTPISTTPLSPLPPRVRKPLSLAGGPASVPHVAEGDERGLRRHKNLPPPPLPPPPPPPPTTPPKNSIFQGREVTVQKVAGTVVKASVVGTGQPVGGTAGGGAVVSGPQRLLGSSGHFPAPTTTPPAPLGPPGVRGGPSSQATPPAPPGIPSVLPGAVPRPCPVPPPIGVPPVPAPPVVQAGLAVLPAVAHGLPGLPPSKQPGPCITPALTAPQQNAEYQGRPFPRGQFSAPGMATLTSPLSLYSAARLGPPPPPPLPPQTDPAGPGLRGPSPPGHTDSARVGGEGGTSYSGQDCPAPGTRGS